MVAGGAQPTTVVAFSHPAKTHGMTFDLIPMRHLMKAVKFMNSKFLLLLLRLTHAGIHFCPLLADTKQYPAFVGHKPGRNNTQRHKLDIQLIMIMNRTLYIAARWVIIAIRSNF